MIREIAGPGGATPDEDRAIIDKFTGMLDAFILMASARLR
jgi:hypothetical protein